MTTSTNTFNINKQILVNAFPSHLKEDVEVVADFLRDKKFEFSSNEVQEIILDGMILKIPSRVYFDNPTETTGNNLNKTQQTILNCIYLRHHNGFIRQMKLEKLQNNSEDYFIIPYIFQLIGEYVIEIIERVDTHINSKTIGNYIKFIHENPTYYQRTESRIISYWNEYYRSGVKYRKLNDYIGKQILDRIKKEEFNISISK